VATRSGGGAPRISFPKAMAHAGPDRRTTLIAARPTPVAGAKIVSRGSIVSRLANGSPLLA
jgi:hypothetical protein